MSLGYRPLGYVMEILESVGIPVSYSYDDLVFVENNSMLVQFNDDKEKELFLYFNEDLDKKVAGELEKVLKKAALNKGFKFVSKGKYQISQKSEENEELEIKFLN